MKLNLFLLRLGKLFFGLTWPLGRRALLMRTGGSVEHLSVLKRLSFSTVVDVGANRGQFALVARKCFPLARIISFEPLPAAAEHFQNLFRDDPLVELRPLALGAADGTADLHVANHDDSSSLLAIGSTQTRLFGTEEAYCRKVEVRRLDNVLRPSDVHAPALLKLDVQGGEMAALQGAGEILTRFTHIYLEASYVELYEGQTLIGPISDFLGALGFRLSDTFNVATDDSGSPVQADFLFVNERT